VGISSLRKKTKLKHTPLRAPKAIKEQSFRVKKKKKRAIPDEEKNFQQKAKKKEVGGV